MDMIKKDVLENVKEKEEKRKIVKQVNRKQKRN